MVHLNENHPVGKHKATVCASALGIISNDAEWLINQIRDKLPECEAVKRQEEENGENPGPGSGCESPSIVIQIALFVLFFSAGVRFIPNQTGFFLMEAIVTSVLSQLRCNQNTVNYCYSHSEEK